MANIRDNINYIFDSLCEIGGFPTTRDIMRPQNASRDQIQWFSKIKCNAANVKTLLHDITICAFKESHNGIDSHYFAIKNMNHTFLQDLFDSTLFSPVVMDDVYFVYFCKLLNLKVDIRYTSAEIDEYLLHQQDDSEYDGHSLSELKDYFEGFCIIKVEDLSLELINDINVCYYYILTSYKRAITLPLHEYTVDKMRDFFICNNKIPKDNIFLSLTSSHLKHCFLELYRCIEWLYVIPRVRKLKHIINYPEPAYTLATHCTNELSWRRKEEDSLARLIEDIIVNDDLINLKMSYSEFFRDVECNSLAFAKHLYSFRNQFVHQFEFEKEKKFESTMLVDAIDILTDLISSVYAYYDQDIVCWK
ncbi:hypothetical protein UXP16_17355 [Enterobacter bugandensis]|uniref:hypothetical protein n=1 Tax=Enterobacter bugandensis TaxID=881260 RepID=UPI002FD07FD5